MKEMLYMKTIVFGQCYADEKMESKLFCENCLTSQCMLNEQKGESVETNEFRLVG